MADREHQVTAGAVTVNAETGTVQFSRDLEIDGQRVSHPMSDAEFRFLMRWAADELENTIRLMQEAGGAQELLEERGRGR